MTIKMTSVFVPDPAAAHRIYTEQLGFISVMFMPEANMAIVASPEDPKGTALMLEPNENPIAKTYQQGLYEAGIPAMVFGVTNIDVEYEKLSALGVQFRSSPTKTDWGYLALMEDGCGNLIQVFQELQ